MRWSVALLVVSGALVACATRPVVYPNDKLRASGRVAVEADTEACLAEAKAYLESGRIPEAAKRTGEGAVVGGAVGAAGGATGGLVHSLWHWRDPDPVEKRYVERCLAERGYDVIGWR
jgi:hypothetical protein